MKIIQSLADIEMLKAIQHIPLPLIKVIEEHFTLMAESEDYQDIIKFRLSPVEALLLLETDHDMKSLTLNEWDLEFVEDEQVGDLTYYRIGVRNDQEVQLCFALKRSFSEDYEAWLDERVEKGREL